jgi:hypothetical protein
MAYTINPNKDLGQKTVIAVRKRVKGLPPQAPKIDEAGELRSLSALEQAFAFFAWLIAFAALGAGLWLAWAYFA